jgi:hypothetical protein
VDATTIAALGAAAHASKPLIQKGAELLDSLLGEPFKVAGGMISDQLYAWRISRAAVLGAKCKDALDRSGVQARQLPTGFLLPFIDAAVSSDPELDGLWANLLASAVEADENQHPALRHALSQMNADEGRILETIHRVGQIPAAWLTDANLFWTRPSLVACSRPAMLPFYFSNLDRLELVVLGGLPVPSSEEWSAIQADPGLKTLQSSGGPNIAPVIIRLTVIGQRLARACIRGPQGQLKA